MVGYFFSNSVGCRQYDSELLTGLSTGSGDNLACLASWCCFSSSSVYLPMISVRTMGTLLGAVIPMRTAHPRVPRASIDISLPIKIFSLGFLVNNNISNISLINILREPCTALEFPLCPRKNLGPML